MAASCPETFGRGADGLVGEPPTWVRTDIDSHAGNRWAPVSHHRRGTRRPSLIHEHFLQTGIDASRRKPFWTARPHLELVPSDGHPDDERREHRRTIGAVAVEAGWPDRPAYHAPDVARRTAKSMTWCRCLRPSREVFRKPRSFRRRPDPAVLRRIRRSWCSCCCSPARGACVPRQLESFTSGRPRVPGGAYQRSRPLSSAVAHSA